MKDKEKKRMSDRKRKNSEHNKPQRQGAPVTVVAGLRCQMFLEERRADHAQY